MLHTRRSGFTLIEMLVVIAIIVVLAAILFPVFGRARENARRTACLSNLQQISAAIALYEGDAGGFLPTWCIDHPLGLPSGQEDDPTMAITWDDSVASYIRSANILKCKSNPYGRDARAYSIAQYTQKLTNGRVLGCNKNEIPNPVKTVLLFEKGANPPGACGDALAQNVYQSHNDDYKTNPADGKMFHFEGKCFLFVDGHAKYYSKGSGPFAWVSGRPDGDTTGIWGSMMARWNGPGICAKAGRQDNRQGGSPQGDWPPAD